MKRYFFIIVLFLFLAILSGRWDRNEPEKLAIVLAGGFDYNPDTDMYKVIFQIVSPLTMKGDSGGGGSGGNKPNYWTVSAWGHTLYDALGNISRKVSRRIVFSHVQLYVMSERMAMMKGVLPVINAVARSRQSRLILTPIICKGDPQEILTAELPIESSNAMGLINQIQLTTQEIASTTQVDARIFLNNLTRPGHEPYAAGIEFSPAARGEEQQSKPGPGMEPPIKLIGMYAFRKDKAAGLLDDRETRGCNWIVGDVKTAILIIKYPGEEENMVDVLATVNSTKIIPIIEDGKPSIEVVIKASGRIVNITGISHIKETSEITKSLNKRMAQVIKTDIEMSIKKCQELKSDIFGFGYAFYRLKYDEWENMQGNWEEIFAELPVQIKVEAGITSMGMVNKGPDIQ